MPQCNKKTIQTIQPRKFRPPKKPRQFRSSHSNQVKVDPPPRNKVIFDHPKRNELKLDAHTKIKLFPTRVQNQYYLNALTKTKLFETRILKPTQFRPFTQEPINRFPREKQVIFGPHEKNKSTLTPAPKPSDCRSPRKNGVSFDRRTKNEAISITTPKPVELRSRTRKVKLSYTP